MTSLSYGAGVGQGLTVAFGRTSQGVVAACGVDSGSDDDVPTASAAMPERTSPVKTTDA